MRHLGIRCHERKLIGSLWTSVYAADERVSLACFVAHWINQNPFDLTTVFSLPFDGFNTSFLEAGCLRIQIRESLAGNSAAKDFTGRSRINLCRTIGTLLEERDP